ncbi:type II toxin-antitoxin system death-on-curing family toxin [Butyricicoccus sp. 1XD8-22]|nr:type II toxin-antitoxin system death-on-curing family toxin [Butyricicoccus sp. 1XD8-22]
MGFDSENIIYLSVENVEDLHELASGHCFADGNKRTALLATYAFLELNGYELTSDDEGETDLFVRMIADAHTRPELDVVVKWIHENTRIKVNQDEYEYEIE